MNLNFVKKYFQRQKFYKKGDVMSSEKKFEKMQLRGQMAGNKLRKEMEAWIDLSKAEKLK